MPNRPSRPAAARSRTAIAAWALLAALAVAPGASGCGGASSQAGARTPVAEKWFQRAQTDFGSARIDAAHEAIDRALGLAPNDPEVRTLGARIALARLEFDESIRLLGEVPGSDAQGLRGRAHWYRGDLAAAADELEGMLQDPEVRDEWAREVAGLARRGQGRTPFAVSGSMLAAVEMAHVSPVVPYLIVPVEIDGEQCLAMLSTGMAEVVVDSSTRAEASWISLRFDGKLEVADVPALVQDLSGVSRELGVPIKALLGVNLLRHLNATIDYYGRQFVVRSFPSPPPPHATRLDVWYAKGGGMLLETGLGADEASRGALFVDSSMRFPIALDEAGWAKAGVALGDLRLVAGDPEQKLREGVVPNIKLGAFDLRRVPGVLGAPVADVEKNLRLDLDGVLGTPVLATYRITFGDGGRMVWLEDETSLRLMLGDLEGAGAPVDAAEGASPGAAPAPPAAPGAP